MTVATPSLPDWVENGAEAAWWKALDTRELWARRELVLAFALRDLKLRYTQTGLGVLWVLIQPLAGLAIFTVVFGHFVKVPSEGLPYSVFVYAGLIVWTYVSTSVYAAAESLVRDAALVTKVYFPRVLAPFAAVLPGLLDLGISLLFLAILMGAVGVSPGPQLALLPAWVLAAAMLSLAAGLWLSSLNVRYRDVRHALGFLLQLWFFASPIVFTSGVFSGAWRYLLFANPLAGLLDGFRWSLIGAPAPGLDALVSLGSGLLLFLTGLAYFRHVERTIADRI